MKKILALILLSMGFSACGQIPMNQSSEIFFPPSVAKPLAKLRAFPITWWNFLVIDGGAPDLCAKLKRDPSVARAVCEVGLSDFAGILGEWTADYPLRAPPPEKLRLALNQAQAAMSAPLGAEFLGLLRSDPLRTTEELLHLSRNTKLIGLPFRDGFYRIGHGSLVVVPIQVRFPSNDFHATQALVERLEGLGPIVGMLGPHFAAWKNQARIVADVGVVSLVGSILLLAMLGVLFATGRAGFFLMVPPVLLGILLSAWFTAKVQGSIHGLTLAFGSSIIGLALDYAFHGFLRGNDPRAWTSNFIGLITSLAMLFVIAGSELPLLRELMLFSIVGLSLAYVFVYIAARTLPDRFRVRAFDFHPQPRARLAPTTIFISILGILGAIIFLRPDFSLAGLEFQSRSDRIFTQQIFQESASEPPLFLTGGDPTIAQELEEKKIARVMMPESFFPILSTRIKNLEAWLAFSCPEPKFKATALEEKLFEPFFANISCKRIRALLLREQGRPENDAPAYLNDLHGLRHEGESLSLILPASESAARAIREKFPHAVSFRGLAEEFPRLLRAELSWMLPLGFFIVALILFLYFRDGRATLGALLPFFIACGATAIGILVFRQPFSFVSIVALLMLFGLSVDYGVFTVDHFRHRSPSTGVWTALIFTGATNALGFAPLLFCGHPVLVQLGVPLFFGTIGTLLGSFIVVPWWMGAKLAK